MASRGGVVTLPERSRLSITRQFLLVGGIMMTLAAVVSGYIMSEITQQNALDTTAGDTALFVSAIASPVAEELAQHRSVTPASKTRLNALLQDNAFSARFPFLEIWLPDGTIAYSNFETLTGKTFALPDAAQDALEGHVASALSDLAASEHRSRRMTQSYLEVYTPLRAPDTGEIVAVAEIHEVSDSLKGTLAWLRVQTWLVTAAVGILIMGGLYGVIAKAARQIDSQQARLAQKVSELQQTLEINLTLRERVRQASENVSEINERFLRNLGAELHDGPIQLLGFATLNVERLRRTFTTGKARQILNDHEDVLKEAQAEIRQIAKGLLLPDILDLDLRAVIERAIQIHHARTGKFVEFDCPDKSPDLSAAVKICAFRFVQEGLTNAFKHGDGRAAITVKVLDDGGLSVSVRNSLSSPAPPDGIEEGMGLTGMRERIVSLGGTMSIEITNCELRLVMELQRVCT